MKALCQSCHSSNEECVVFRDLGIPVCINNCLSILKNKVLERRGVKCTCGKPCPLHHEDVVLKPVEEDMK